MRGTAADGGAPKRWATARARAVRRSSPPVARVRSRRAHRSRHAERRADERYRRRGGDRVHDRGSRRRRRLRMSDRDLRHRQWRRPGDRRLHARRCQRHGFRQRGNGHRRGERVAAVAPRRRPRAETAATGSGRDGSSRGGSRRGSSRCATSGLSAFGAAATGGVASGVASGAAGGAGGGPTGGSRLSRSAKVENCPGAVVCSVGRYCVARSASRDGSFNSAYSALSTLARCQVASASFSVRAISWSTPSVRAFV